MPLFSWLFPKSTHTRQLDAGHSVQDGGQGSATRSSSRRNERTARRELLYLVVRDAMMRAGVLSASYKFKVLSLDGRGRQFLVMVDLARDTDGQMAKLARIEAAITQAAKARHDILVTAVYWRFNEQVGIGAPSPRTPVEPTSQPMPLDSLPPSGPVPLSALDEPPPAAVAAPAAAAPARRPNGRFEPIDADEVAAFKRALAAGVERPAPPKGTPHSYTLLTGFEDTEMGDAELLRSSSLSGTQYGDLR